MKINPHTYVSFFIFNLFGSLNSFGQSYIKQYNNTIEVRPFNEVYIFHDFGNHHLLDSLMVKKMQAKKSQTLINKNVVTYIELYERTSIKDSFKLHNLTLEGDTMSPFNFHYWYRYYLYNDSSYINYPETKKNLKKYYKEIGQETKPSFLTIEYNEDIFGNYISSTIYDNVVEDTIKIQYFIDSIKYTGYSTIIKNNKEFLRSIILLDNRFRVIEESYMFIPIENFNRNVSLINYKSDRIVKTYYYNNNLKKSIEFYEDNKLYNSVFLLYQYFK